MTRGAARSMLTLESGWRIRHLLRRTYGGTDDVNNRVLLHPNCHRQVHSEGRVVNKTASREGHS
jgi:RNA-directed DNA polymerase